MIIPGKLDTNVITNQKNIEIIEGVAKLIQIDVADGVIVNGKNELSPEDIATLKSTVPLELDLMVQNPMPYLENLPEAFTKVLTHVEAENTIEFAIAAKELGLKVGVSLMLDTPVAVLEGFLPEIDYVQFRSAEPGDIGRPFDYRVLEKIKLFKVRWPEVETQTDGHMNEKTIPFIDALEVDHFVVGSAIFNNKKPIEKYKELSNLIGDKYV